MFSKKDRLILLIFCLKMYMCAQVCVFLNVSMFVFVMSLTRTYIGIFAHVVAWIFTYIQIFLLSIVRKQRGKGTYLYILDYIFGRLGWCNG